jgi:hypothetical protein
VLHAQQLGIDSFEQLPACRVQLRLMAQSPRVVVLVEEGPGAAPKHTHALYTAVVTLTLGVLGR